MKVVNNISPIDQAEREPVLDYDVRLSRYGDNVRRDCRLDGLRTRLLRLLRRMKRFNNQVQTSRVNSLPTGELLIFCLIRVNIG